MEECPTCKEAIRKIYDCEDLVWWKANTGKDIATLIRGQLQQRRFQAVITVRDLLFLESPYHNNDGNPEISLGTFDTWEDALDATEKLLGPEYKQQVRVLKIGDSWTPWGYRLVFINRYDTDELSPTLMDYRVPGTKEGSEALVVLEDIDG